MVWYLSLTDYQLSIASENFMYNAGLLDAEVRLMEKYKSEDLAKHYFGTTRPAIQRVRCENEREITNVEDKHVSEVYAHLLIANDADNTDSTSEKVRVIRVIRV